MLTCEFFGGRLAEVMQTVASLYHYAYIKKIPFGDIVLPLTYSGKDFYGSKQYIFIENFPIFKKLESNFRYNINKKDFEEHDIANNWGKYYVHTNDYKDKNVILKNHWFDFIYNTNIYYKLYYQSDLWNEIKKPYSSLFNKNTLAIHVRRKDFLLIEKNRDQYSTFVDRKILKINNIKQTIRYCNSTHNILIFSDDIQWCKNNINLKKNVTYIEGNKPYVDLILMSMCNNIMRTPGSTFGKMALSLKNN